MKRFDCVHQEEQWGFVDSNGLPLLVEEHRYGLDPFSLWYFLAGSIAVFFEGLQHIDEEVVKLDSFDGAVVAILRPPSKEAGVEVESLSDGGLSASALAAAATLAGVSAGLLSADETQTVSLGGAKFEVVVTLDFEQMAWRCTTGRQDPTLDA